MSGDQIIILGILAVTVGMFVWGRWRHDMVALASLLACVAAGLVSRDGAFAGFGHPAVITVACVLVLSRALQVSGAVDALTIHLLPDRAGRTFSIASLTLVAAVLSAFMNNVGALALLMPVGMQMAKKLDLPPGRILMPVAFGSILGGMTTLIGTPPNLIVSGFREQTGAGSFGMFDFTPAGLAVAGAGILFVALVGWRLVPARQRADAQSFAAGRYLTEARVGEDSPVAGKTLREIGGVLAKADAQVVGLVRRDFQFSTANPGRRLRNGDILVIEAEPESLAATLTQLKLSLVEDVPVGAGGKSDKSACVAGTKGAGVKQAQPDAGAGQQKAAAPDSGDIALIEVAVRPDTTLVERSATDIQLRHRFGINLLALSRQGQHSIRRLRSEQIRAGDVLLLQGAPGAIMNFANYYGCVPLAERPLRIPNKRHAATAAIIMALAVGGAAFGLVPAAIAFAAGALACLVFRVLPPRTVYNAVDWPVVVLLASLIPVADAMATTGTADLIARALIGTLAGGNAVFALAIILVVTMTLSDFMNNAATAAVMCPIAISAALTMEVCPDAFLMAVAIGASCAFLTPIGHQNNTLILGPGGFRFGDYWPLGLPLEIIVVLVGVPMLLIVWPL